MAKEYQLNPMKNMPTSLKVKPTKSYSDCIPARYVLCLLIFWALFLEYAHRLCLSVAIVAMVNQTAVSSYNGTDNPDVCPAAKSRDDAHLSNTGKYLWSPSTQGVILGAYFYGYVCTQLLGGRLAEIWGGKWLLGSAIFLASLLTLLTPIAADMGVAAIAIVRVSMGLSHGVCLPAAFAMFAQWAPINERSTLIAISVIGGHMGTVLSLPLTGYLSGKRFSGGWPAVFYILGTLGCIWFILWCFLAYSKPADHPRISKQELEYIKKNQYEYSVKEKLPVPWRKILTSMPVWSVAIVTLTAAWGHSTIMTELPTYLEVVLHVPIEENGIVNSLIHVCICVTLFISGYLSDNLRSNKYLSPTKVRKSFEFIAMVGAAICTSLLPTVGCNYAAAVILLAIAMTFLGLTGGGHVSISIEMAPQYSGTIFGLVNGIGCVSGIFSPLVAGLLLNGGHGNISEWSEVFYISAGSYLVGAIVFTIWASAEVQEWAISRVIVKSETLSDNKCLLQCRRDLEASFKYGAIP